MVRHDDAAAVRQLARIREQAARVLDVHGGAGGVRVADESPIVLGRSREVASLGASSPGRDRAAADRGRGGGATEIGCRRAVEAHLDRRSRSAARARRDAARRRGRAVRATRRRPESEGFVRSKRKPPSPSGPGVPFCRLWFRPARTNSAGRKPPYRVASRHHHDRAERIFMGRRIILQRIGGSQFEEGGVAVGAGVGEAVGATARRSARVEKESGGSGPGLRRRRRALERDLDRRVQSGGTRYRFAGADAGASSSRLAGHLPSREPARARRSSRIFDVSSESIAVLPARSRTLRSCGTSMSVMIRARLGRLPARVGSAVLLDHRPRDLVVRDRLREGARRDVAERLASASGANATFGIESKRLSMARTGFRAALSSALSRTCRESARQGSSSREAIEPRHRRLAQLPERRRPASS